MYAKGEAALAIWAGLVLGLVLEALLERVEVDVGDTVLVVTALVVAAPAEALLLVGIKVMPVTLIGTLTLAQNC